MIEGIRRAGCDRRIFRHNDLGHLRALMENDPADQPKVIAFESVYSMDGDIAPLEALCDLADEFDALTYLDEVHAVGMYGEEGAGVAQRDDVMDRIDIYLSGHGGWRVEERFQTSLGRGPTPSRGASGES